MSSRCRFAPLTTTKFTPQARNESGGRIGSLDPLAAARDLWQESRQLGADVDTSSQETSNDPKHGVLAGRPLDPLGGTGG